ncbi:MAG: hypothetical protein IT292_10665 [Deltaproteobacteria bacterium]|nr:hypothetical protein [Deltaproteobacteria bacterium]
MSIGYQYCKWIEFLFGDYDPALKLGGDIKVSDEIELSILQAIMKATSIVGEQDPNVLTNALMTLGGQFKVAAVCWVIQSSTARKANKAANNAAKCYDMAVDCAELAELDWTIPELQEMESEAHTLALKTLPKPARDFPIP